MANIMFGFYTWLLFIQVLRLSSLHFEISRTTRLPNSRQNLILNIFKTDSVFICSHKCQLVSECKYANFLEEKSECQLIRVDDHTESQNEGNGELITLTKVIHKFSHGRCIVNTVNENSSEIVTTPNITVKNATTTASPDVPDNSTEPQPITQAPPPQPIIVAPPQPIVVPPPQPITQAPPPQ
eukprot:TCONS_00063501-protein